MAQRVREHIVGVDVCKGRLDIHEWATGKSYAIANTSQAIAQWLALWIGRSSRWRDSWVSPIRSPAVSRSPAWAR